MSKLIKFVAPIPMGMKVYVHGMTVLVPRNHRRIAWKFVRGRKRRIYLQYESDDKQNSSVIRVIGKSKGWFFEKEKCFGFVPDNITNMLENEGLVGKIKPRLQLIAIGNDTSIDIRVNLLGPMDDYERLLSHG